MKNIVRYADDTSVAVENAERQLKVLPGQLTLDQLAELLSLSDKFKDEQVTVRNPRKRPIPHSKVYFRGQVVLGLLPNITRR